MMAAPMFPQPISQRPLKSFGSSVIAPPLPKPGKTSVPKASAKQAPSAAPPPKKAAAPPKMPREPEGLQAFVADKYKTNFCRSFEQGKSCPFGFNCMFAHSLDEKRTVEMNIRDGILTAGNVDEFKRTGGVAASGSPETPVLAERYKTHFCRSYEKKEICPYGHRCIFAHTQEEIRTQEMNIKDKLFTLEAIEAFKRAQPIVPTTQPTVRVGNELNIASSDDANKESEHPEPTPTTDSILDTTLIKKKKQRRYKPHCLKKEAYLRKTALLGGDAMPKASATFGIEAQVYPFEGSLVSGIIPFNELPLRSRPLSEINHIEEESLLQETVQALINLIVDDDE